MEEGIIEKNEKEVIEAILPKNQGVIPAKLRGLANFMLVVLGLFRVLDLIQVQEEFSKEAMVVLVVQHKVPLLLLHYQLVEVEVVDQVDTMVQ